MLGKAASHEVPSNLPAAVSRDDGSNTLLRCSSCLNHGNGNACLQLSCKIKLNDVTQGVQSTACNYSHCLLSVLAKQLKDGFSSALC